MANTNPQRSVVIATTRNGTQIWRGVNIPKPPARDGDYWIRHDDTIYQKGAGCWRAIEGDALDELLHPPRLPQPNASYGDY